MPPKTRTCAALSCQVEYGTDPQKTFFRFPKDINRLNIWVQRSGDRRLLKCSSKLLTEGRYLCPKHFEPEMFWDNKKSKLQRRAIPSIFTCPPLSNDEMLLASWLNSSAVSNSTWTESLQPRGHKSPLQFSEGKSSEPFLFESAPSSAATPVVPLPCSLPSDSPRQHHKQTSFDHTYFKPPSVKSISSLTSEAATEQMDQINPFGKRPRGSEDDDILTSDFTPPEKKVLLENVIPDSPRRSSVRNGATTREKAPTKTRMTVKGIANMCQIPLTDSNKKALKTAQQYRLMAKKVGRRLKKSQEENASLKVLAQEKFQSMVEELLITPRLRKMLQAELINFKRKPKGRVWTLDDKLFALALYKRSPRAYRFLRQHILLPCESSLKSILQAIPLDPGISQPLLSLLQKNVSNMSEKDKCCVLLFDEMFLSARLFFNRLKKNLLGFENYGKHGKTDLVADHALVFMVQGVHSKWTQPIAYYFVHKTCPSDLLKVLICDVVTSLLNIGLNVLATVSDQGPTNRGAVSLLKESSLNDEIIYAINGHRLVHIFDVPHLMKSSRNNLLSSDLEFQTGKVAKWRHLVEFYLLDSSVASTLKTLTQKHLNPKGKDKMRVKYAAQVLSESVAKQMEAFYRLSHGTYLKDCMVTAELVRDINLFFDLTNGPSPTETDHPTRSNVFQGSLHNNEWPKMIAKLEKWTFVRKSTGQRHVPPFVKGWIQTVKGLQWLSKNSGLRVLKLRNINQDALENLFCCIRQCAGSSSDLTCSQFSAALKTCIITRFCSNGVRDKNCSDDDSYLLSDLRSLLQPSVGDLQESAPTLIRGARPEQEGHQASVNAALSSSFLTKIFFSEIHSDCNMCKDSLLKANSVSKHWINSFVSKCKVLFKNLCNRYIHKDDVFEKTLNICEPNDAEWSWFKCPAHTSTMKAKVQEKIAVHLLETKCRTTNEAIKAQGFKRTRQALSGAVKDKDGLLEEDAMELDSDDVLFLEGSLDNTPPNLATVQSSAVTPRRTPGPQRSRTPAPQRVIRTPGQIHEPMAKIPVQKTSASTHAPSIESLPPPSPRTPARQKVFLSWAHGASGSTSASVESAKSIPEEEFPPQKMSVNQLVQENKVHMLTVPELKAILKGKIKITGLKKKELCDAVYEQYKNM